LPGHRSTRVGPARPLWLVVIAAVLVAGLLTWPVLGFASLGVVGAVFLAGLMVVSARNDYGLTD